MTNRNQTENFNQVSFFGHSVPHSHLLLRCPDLPVCSPVCESLQHLLFFVQPSPWVGCSLGYPCVPVRFFLANTQVLAHWAWNSSVPYVPASPDSTAMTDEPDTTSPNTLTTHAPAPLALPSILDSSPPTPPPFPLTQQ